MSKQVVIYEAINRIDKSREVSELTTQDIYMVRML